MLFFTCQFLASNVYGIPHTYFKGNTLKPVILRSITNACKNQCKTEISRKKTACRSCVQSVSHFPAVPVKMPGNNGKTETAACITNVLHFVLHVLAIRTRNCDTGLCRFLIKNYDNFLIKRINVILSRTKMHL